MLTIIKSWRDKIIGIVSSFGQCVTDPRGRPGR
jgi:hypothetical protein